MPFPGSPGAQAARLDTVDEDLLRLMREAGCHALYFGIETPSPSLQRTIGKRLPMDRFDVVLGCLSSLGIHATFSFITGFPTETADDQELLLRYSLRARFTDIEKMRTQIHTLTFDPGTSLTRQYGHLLRFDRHAHPGTAYLPRSWHPLAIKVASSARIFSSFFHVASPPAPDRARCIRLAFLNIVVNAHMTWSFAALHRFLADRLADEIFARLDQMALPEDGRLYGYDFREVLVSLRKIGLALLRDDDELRLLRCPLAVRVGIFRGTVSPE